MSALLRFFAVFAAYSCIQLSPVTAQFADPTVQVQIVVAPMSENVTTPNTLMIWRCIAIGLPLPNITWSRNGLPLLNLEMTTNTAFTKGGVTFVQSTLEMCIDDRASGEYTCIASNSYTNDSADYSIFVPPRIVRPPTDKRIIIGESYNFTCEVSGFPHPTVTWIRNGSPLGANGHMSIHSNIVQSHGLDIVRSILEVHHVKPAVEGHYECVAKNTINSVSKGFDIGAQATKILVAPSGVKSLHGRESLLLSCVAYGYPPPSLYWRNIKTGNTLTSNDRLIVHNSTSFVTRDGTTLYKTVMEICDAQESDSGEYSCVVDNKFMTESSNFNVRVQKSVNILLSPSDTEVVVGQTIFLPCVAYSYSGYPQLTWTAGDSNITQSNSPQMTVLEYGNEYHDKVVVLRSVLVVNYCALPDLEDTNEYGCYVSNGVEESHTTFKLQVKSTTTSTEVIPDERELSPKAPVSAASGIGHTSYSIGLIANIFFVFPVMFVYLAFGELRGLPITMPLINFCVALTGLNICVVAAYNVTAHGISNELCNVVASLFQYFFLVTMLAISVMVFVTLTRIYKKLRKYKTDKTNKKVYVLTALLCLAVNWGAPVIVILITVLPDPSSYTNGPFCGSLQWRLWFGGSLFVLTHIITWFIFLTDLHCLNTKIISDNNEKQREDFHLAKERKQRYQILILLLVFDLTWAVGLPAITLEISNQPQIVLRFLFLFGNLILPIVLFLAFCILPREVRDQLKKQAVIDKEQNQENHDSVFEAQAQDSYKSPDPKTYTHYQKLSIKRLRISSSITSVGEMDGRIESASDEIAKKPTKSGNPELEQSEIFIKTVNL